MAYSINPNLPRARAIALRLLIADNLPALVVANRCGIHRTTLWRWKNRWLQINKNLQIGNFNRPNRIPGRTRLLCSRWLIPTISSRPRRSPNAIPGNIVDLVIKLRQILNRCAEVIWYHITNDNDISISLSSVRRILKRHLYIDGRKKRVKSSNPIRPTVTKPGELIQTDTIHYVDLMTRRKRYVYTVIDLYSRMAYAEIHNVIRPGIATTVLLRAEGYFGFKLAMVQADNGLEFGRYFEQQLNKHQVKLRHSRLGRPNDNAHIERFNRTIQEECLGRYLNHRQSIKHIQAKINKYLEFYNAKRVHLGLQLKTPLQMLQSS